MTELATKHHAIVVRVKEIDAGGGSQSERDQLMARRLVILGLLAKQVRRANCAFCKKYPEKCS